MCSWARLCWAHVQLRLECRPRACQPHVDVHASRRSGGRACAHTHTGRPARMVECGGALRPLATTCAPSPPSFFFSCGRAMEAAATAFRRECEQITACRQREHQEVDRKYDLLVLGVRLCVFEHTRMWHACTRCGFAHLLVHPHALSLHEQLYAISRL